MYRIWKLVFNSMIQVVIVNALVLPLLLAQSVFAQSTQPQSPGQIKATIKFALKGHTRPIGYSLFSPDGRSIITMGYDETARIWDVNTGQTKAIIKLCPRCDTTDIAWSPDSTRIVIHSSRLTHKDLGLTQVLTSDGKLQLTLEGHESELGEVQWSPDGRSIMTAGADGKAILWDAETGRQKHALVHMPPRLKQTDSLINSIFTGKRGFDESDIYAMFFADGKRVVTYTGSGNRGPLKLWDAETGALLSEFLLATLPDEMARPYMDNQFWTYWWSWLNIRHVSSPDRRLTVRHLKKQGYELIEVGTGNVIARDESNGFPISFSPDGKSLLFHQTFESKSIWGDPKTVISLRDLTTGQTKVVFNELREAGYDNYWSPSGHRVITGYRHLLDTNTGNMISKLPYKCVPGALFGEDGCGDYTFSADGQYFTKDQKDVFIWRAGNGQRLTKITGARGQAAFSPTDARIFISNSPDKSTTLIWELSDQ